MTLIIQAFDSGLFETASQFVVTAGTVILLLMLVALGAFVYKSLRGDGITWPDDQEETDDEVQHGSDDDDWKYY
ncbi:hypothetical protein ACFQL3_01040 [Natronoarchaeum sp. GCM10025321]|uniref:hypothetical protein n=2 Tax=unclassified Natronoarchaeum TaxID=2620183 RepID=UPI003617063A